MFHLPKWGACSLKYQVTRSDLRKPQKAELKSEELVLFSMPFWYKSPPEVNRAAYKTLYCNVNDLKTIA